MKRIVPVLIALSASCSAPELSHELASVTTTARNGWTAYMTVPSFLRDDPLVARSPDSESFVVLFRQFPKAAEGRFRVVRFSSSGDTILDREGNYGGVAHAAEAEAATAPFEVTSGA